MYKKEGFNWSCHAIDMLCKNTNTKPVVIQYQFVVNTGLKQYLSTVFSCNNRNYFK